MNDVLFDEFFKPRLVVGNQGKGMDSSCIDTFESVSSIIAKVGESTFYIMGDGRMSRIRPWWQWKEIWNH